MAVGSRNSQGNVLFRRPTRQSQTHASTIGIDASEPSFWRQDLQPPFRSRQEVTINAPLEAVWSYSMDLTKIPAFHPRVVKVDLLSGSTLRESGASYRCHLSGGKHSCIEKDIEIISLHKIVTVLLEDTFGVTKILSDYRVETTFKALGPRSTKVEISHYYSTTTLKAKLLNLIAKGKIAREARSTLNAAKAQIEAAWGWDRTLSDRF
jgi:Polyketide cyclase / dehydrase and lipid transport